MRYFVGFLVTMGLIIILVLLLFGGGGSKKAPTPSKSLTEYANTNTVVRMTIDGPINSQQTHQQIRITVGRDQVTFEHMQGYTGTVVSSESFANNVPAYDVFLHALKHVNFTQGNTDPKLRDERGYCPLGDRYIFEILQDGTDLERFWSTNCRATKTYLGELGLTLDLFQAQVPDYNTQVQSIQL